MDCAQKKLLNLYKLPMDFIKKCGNIDNGREERYFIIKRRRFIVLWVV